MEKSPITPSSSKAWMLRLPSCPHLLKASIKRWRSKMNSSKAWRPKSLRKKTNWRKLKVRAVKTMKNLWNNYKTRMIWFKTSQRPKISKSCLLDNLQIKLSNKNNSSRNRNNCLNSSQTQTSHMNKVLKNSKRKMLRQSPTTKPNLRPKFRKWTKKWINGPLTKAYSLKWCKPRSP